MNPIKRSDLNNVALLLTAEVQRMSKMKGEKDTEFIARIVVTYLNAVKVLERETKEWREDLNNF
jgi:hypothetical protein